MIENQIIEVDGQAWKVRQAISKGHALNTIEWARRMGSVRAKDTRDETLGGGFVVVIADVVQLNSDGTERQPYQPSV